MVVTLVREQEERVSQIAADLGLPVETVVELLLSGPLSRVD